MIQQSSFIHEQVRTLAESQPAALKRIKVLRESTALRLADLLIHYTGIFTVDGAPHLIA